jgi:hypothetical protein
MFYPLTVIPQAMTMWKTIGQQKFGSSGSDKNAEDDASTPAPSNEPSAKASTGGMSYNDRYQALMDQARK